MGKKKHTRKVQSDDSAFYKHDNSDIQAELDYKNFTNDTNIDDETVQCHNCNLPQENLLNRQIKSQQTIHNDQDLYPIIEAVQDDSSVNMNSINDNRDDMNNYEFPRYEM